MNLKPCPFCGGKPNLIKAFASYVKCESCGSESETWPIRPEYNNVEKAIESWNNRT
jgi:Lar family restriction alleviation protein